MLLGARVGLFLGYTTIYLSLRAGLVALTASNETLVVMHIYNALKDRGMIYELPLLDDLDSYFDKTLSFWNGWDKPEQGKYLYRFNMSLGSTHELATWIHDKARYKLEGGIEPSAKPKSTLSKYKHNRNNSKRVAVDFDPASVSESYKYQCKYDYGNIEEKMQGPNVPEHLKIDPSSPFPMPFQMHEARFYILCQSLMSELRGILQYNMVAVGTTCAQFLHETFHPDRNEGVARVASRPDLPFNHPGAFRTFINMGIAEEVLIGLDYCDEDTLMDKYSYLAEAFENFFENLDMDSVHIYELD